FSFGRPHLGRERRRVHFAGRPQQKRTAKAVLPCLICAPYFFMEFMTAPTIAVRMAPPPAPPTMFSMFSEPARPPTASAAAAGSIDPPVIALSSKPPATPPIAPLRILGS